VRNPHALHSGGNDHPAWRIGGGATDIPILYLDGGPSTRPGFGIGDNPWCIIFNPDDHADAARYLRELATVATELADQLDKANADDPRR
jgi:hypothetical protein